MALKEREYSVVLIAARGSELEKRSHRSGIKTIGLKITNNSPANPFLRCRIGRILQANRIGTILLNLSVDLKVGGIVANSLGVENIIYRRGLAKTIRSGKINRYLLKNVTTKIIATSADTRNAILKNFSGYIDPGKIEIIYNGVNIPEEQERPVSNDKFIIGSAGRLSKEKGHLRLVELASVLLKEGIDFQIHIAGEGDQIDLIRKEAVTAGISERLIFDGFLDDMDPFYRKLDMFVLPSEKEGFANVLLEAMSYGIPVVAFDIGSPSELIINDVNGLIIPSMDVALMGKKIAGIIKSDNRLNDMGKKARQRVLTGFTHKSHYDSIEALIR
ncbi:MAG: glycosyltransferase family 4 protein [Bacteroidales bacterium]|nr:glycosyltransferase family 4 protein [Bacteroidales bacterium]